MWLLSSYIHQFSLFDDRNVPTPGLVSQSGNEASAGFTEAHSEAFLTL